MRSAARAARSGSSSCSYRDPEEGRDPVAHERADRSAVLFHCSRHAVDAFADQDLHLVGGKALPEARRPDHVGKERSHRAQFVALVPRPRFFARALDRRRQRRRQRRGRGLGSGARRRGVRLWLGDLRRSGCRGGCRRGERCHHRVLLTRSNLDLDRGRSHVDDISVAEPCRRRDPLAVHPGAVHRAEILDLDRSCSGPDCGMAPGHERIVDRDIRIHSPDDQLGLDCDALSGERTVLQEQGRHGPQCTSRREAACGQEW